MIKSTRFMVTITAFATTIALAPTAASTAADPTSEASASHTLAVAGIDASALKAGWSLEGDEIVWPDGTMASTGPAVYEDCTAGYVCFWENDSYTGRRLQFDLVGSRNMADFSFNDQMSSWRSRRSLDARWYYNAGDGGTSRCIESISSNSNVGSGGLNFDNDEASSLKIYNDDTSC